MAETFDADSVWQDYDDRGNRILVSGGSILSKGGSKLFCGEHKGMLVFSMEDGEWICPSGCGTSAILWLKDVLISLTES